MFDNIYILIGILGLVTYATRFGGDLILSRFKTLNPRVEAALEAVPAAVLTTIAIPPALTNGPAEFIAMLIAFIIAFRLSPIPIMIIGVGCLVLMRNMGL